MSTTPPTVKELTTVRNKLLQSIKKFPQDKRNHIFYGDWTIKEVIAHISAWDIYFAQLIKSHIKGNPIDYWGNINDFNKREVNHRIDMSLIQTINEFEKVSQEFINAFKKIPNDLINQKIWPNRNYTPQSILKIQIHHYHSQTKQILKRY